jgi:predicted PurR-regulated permease PerM
MLHAPLDPTTLRCPGRVMTETRFRQAFLLLLVTAISAAFVAMIRAFLLTILLAAIFAGLSYPRL